MKFEIPQTIVELAIEARLDNDKGAGNNAQRLEYRVGELVCGIINKELKQRGILR